jgi:hypothetical protein
MAAVVGLSLRRVGPPLPCEHSGRPLREQGTSHKKDDVGSYSDLASTALSTPVPWIHSGSLEDVLGTDVLLDCT